MAPIVLTRNDKKFDMQFTVKDGDGVVLDLANAEVRFQLADLAYVNVIDGVCEITDADEGECKYTFADGDLDLAPGNYWGCIEYTLGDKVISSTQFVVKIIPECG